MTKLLAIDDRRPIDFDTGKRLAASDADLQPCARCDKLHAITWVVEDDDGRTWRVGSGCAKRLFDGWTPNADEKRTARKALRAAVELAKEAEVERLTSLIIDALPADCTPPAPVLDKTLDDGTEIWKTAGASVWVRPSRGESLADPAVAARLRDDFAFRAVAEVARTLDASSSLVNFARRRAEQRFKKA